MGRRVRFLHNVRVAIAGQHVGSVGQIRIVAHIGGGALEATLQSWPAGVGQRRRSTQTRSDRRGSIVQNIAGVDFGAVVAQNRHLVVVQIETGISSPIRWGIHDINNHNTEPLYSNIRSRIPCN